VSSRSLRFKWRDALWESDVVKNELLVGLALERFMRDDLSKACPAVATIMRLTGLGERTVRRSLRELEAAEWIEVEKRASQHDTTIYRGRFPEVQTGGHSDTPGRAQTGQTGPSGNTQTGHSGPSGAGPGGPESTLRGARIDAQGGHTGPRSRRDISRSTDPGPATPERNPSPPEKFNPEELERRKAEILATLPPEVSR
jgi:hypothetical protein